MEMKIEQTQSPNLFLIETIKTAISKGEFLKTKKLLKAVIAQDLFDPEPYNLMGIVFEFEKEIVLAGKMYRAALAVDPSYSPATVNLDRISQLRYTMDGINYGDVPETHNFKETI